jgi:hypothetical protein
VRQNTPKIAKNNGWVVDTKKSINARKLMGFESHFFFLVRLRNAPKRKQNKYGHLSRTASKIVGLRNVYVSKITAAMIAHI